MGADEAAVVFERHRPYLLGVAYRLTGSWAEAEDAVADAWPRWERHEAAVEEPRGWLTRVVGRIALDQLRSARVRREKYVGPWLPEPLVTAAGASPLADLSTVDPVDHVLWDESVRMAFLIVLDQLTPEQRLAVVLHDAVGLDFAEVAEVIGCSPSAARQHASRGRRHIDASRVPPRIPTGDAWRVLGELAAALKSGDALRIAALLTEDVVLTGDGGGQVTAARRPVTGRDGVARFLGGFALRYADRARLSLVWVNGEPGMIAHVDSDRPQDADLAVYSLTIRDGLIEALYGVLAPDKVARVPPEAVLIEPSAPPPARR